MKIKIAKSVLDEIRRANEGGSEMVSKKAIKFLYHHLGARLISNSEGMIRVECFGMKFLCLKKTRRRLTDAARAKMSHVSAPVPAKRYPPKRAT